MCDGDRIDALESKLETALERIDELESTVDELENENEEQAERIDELENQPRFEARGDGIGEVWLTGIESERDRPFGSMFEGRAETLEKIDERIGALENGDVGQDNGRFGFSGSLTHADLMPLHQKRFIAEHMDPNEHKLTPNQERAAWAFDHIEDRMHVVHGEGTLTSNDMRALFKRDLAREDEQRDQRLNFSDPNPNTIRRTMKFIAEFSDGIITFEKDDGKLNRLEIDATELRKYREGINKKANDQTGNRQPAQGGAVITPS